MSKMINLSWSRMRTTWMSRTSGPGSVPAPGELRFMKALGHGWVVGAVVSHICMDRTVVQETTIKSPLMAHTRLENIYENNQNIFKNSFASKLLSLCHKLWFSIIPISMQPGSVNRWCFKLRLLNPTEFIISKVTL